MTIDKPREPKIPELLLGVSRETLGDPCGGDGGGGGKRMRDGSWRGMSRRSMERQRRMGAQQGGRSGSRSTLERQRMMGAQQGGRSGSRRTMERQRKETRSTEGWTGHARNAAEEQQIWRRNTRDGTWRRSGGEPQPGPLSPAQGGLWRPWVAEEEAEESLQTIVSIADPSNYNHPVYFASTDIRTRSQFQKGK